jgi:hypothetical protein
LRIRISIQSLDNRAIEDGINADNNDVDYYITNNPAADEVVIEWEVTSGSIKLPPRIRDMSITAGCFSLSI